MGQEKTSTAAVLSLLTFASIWGTLARLGLVALNTYHGQSVDPVVWAQGVACLSMGWCIANKDELVRWYPPLYVCLTTGLCGSISTFSIWILGIFRAFGDQQHYQRGGLHNVMDALSQTFVTLAVSMSCLAAGKELGGFMSAAKLASIVKRRRGKESITTSLEAQNSNMCTSAPSPSAGDAVQQPTPSYRSLHVASVVLGLSFWIGSAVLCALYAPWRNVTFSIVLAPPGTILRFYLAQAYNQPSNKANLPRGTQAANLFATAVVCAAFVVQNVGRAPGSLGGGASTSLACQAAYGLEEGFCGCLSTISTFAVELHTLQPRKAVAYAVSSWVAGVILCVLIIGVPWWTLGMDGSCVGLHS